MTRRSLIICFGMLLGCSLAVAKSQPTMFLLTHKGYGPVIFGKKTKDLEKIAGLAVPENKTDEPECRYIKFKKIPGMLFMEEDGVITRAEPGPRKNVANAFGIKIGTPLQEIRRKHPEVVVEPHHYDATGHYLIFAAKDNKSAVVFEEGAGKVSDIRAGLRPSVDYVEGCQ